MSTPVCKHPSRDMDSVYLCTTCLEELEAENTRLREALRPFAEFGFYLHEHPHLGLANEMYGLDNLVFLRKSDCERAALAVGKGESR